MRQKKIFILSPCGTSLLTNQSQYVTERKLIGKYANTKKPNEIFKDDKDILQDIIDKTKNKLENADLKSASNMSAELHGIIKLYDSRINNRREDYHLLLCTDTWIGESTTNLISGWLRKKGLTVEVIRQKDLRTIDLPSFQCALSEIVRWCEDTIPGYKAAGYHIVFNLTGGFKSVQGFLQTLAAFYADESVYIFETAEDLLRIPRLPVKMAAEDIICRHLKIFRRLAMGLHVDMSAISDLPETLIMTIDKDIALSPWGEIAWKQTKKNIYEKEIYTPPTDKLIFGKNFRSIVLNLPSDRLRIVNERIDEISNYLETKYNPRSLDFKKLKGNPCSPSTHEIDAWSDKDAKRIFGHYKDNKNQIFILDKLDKGLH